MLHDGRPALLDDYPFELAGQTLLLPNGLLLDYTGLQHDGRQFVLGKQKLWGGVLTENIVQALARIVMTDAWLAVEDSGFHLVLTVHDELVFCVEENEVQRAKEVMQDLMTKSPSWMPNLPLAIDIGSGENYGK
jgi:DNA polymerase